MLPGDEVVLLLTPIAGHTPEYRAFTGQESSSFATAGSHVNLPSGTGWMDRASQTCGGRWSIHSSP